LFHSNPLFPTFNHFPGQASTKIIALFDRLFRSKLPLSKRCRVIRFSLLFRGDLVLSPFLKAQASATGSNDTVRATVIVNADGSRTTYQ
jgi:hypothetical protein